MLLAPLLVAMLLAGAPALAQPAAPAASSEAARAERRFPQPVRVGDLVRRQVLRPVEQQDVLGRVAAVVRRPSGPAPDDQVLVVVDIAGPGLGGALGLGVRPVAVPVETMALLGEYMALIDLTPAQLRALPTFDPAGTAPVPPDDTIRVGLVRPFH